MGTGARSSLYNGEEERSPVISIFSLLLIPYVVSSADEGAKGGVLEEVVVTARKREETAQSVPIPISALSEAQLEARNITDLQDVERITPNMDFTSSAVGNQNTQVFIRGIGQVNWSTTQDPKIGIYIDGVYLSLSLIHI